MAQVLDVAVIGGGPAGISTALHVQAAAPNTRMIVVEKARYPRDKICAGGIGGRAFRLLEKIGVEVACPHVPLDAVAMRIGGKTLIAHQPGCGAVVRRIEFDHAFAEVARSRGISVRDGTAVEHIAIDPSGVTLQLGDGEQLRARCLIGADGVAGIVRRQLGFPRGELRAQVVEVDTEAAADDLPRDTLVFDFLASALRGYAWDFPTQVAGQPLVCRGLYALGHGADPRARIAEYLTRRGLPAEGRKLKQFAERGWEPGADIARPRVLLVGEAAGIDIATGEGIAQAIEYGAVAGGYLARALAEDNLGFADWRPTVDRHHLGIQMRIRHAAYRVVYGRGRPTVEKIMPRLTQLFRAGVEDFAGVPVSRLAVAHGVAQFLAAATRVALLQA